MKKLLWILFFLCPTAAFSGQHSGLGGGTTPAPSPPPPPAAPSGPAADALHWILEQVEMAKPSTQHQHQHQPLSSSNKR
ncbi:MAG: hypothetical protein H7249_10100 [Chitinophagaceae bacterium]|nr:hypothetical protein [Oligoflexus sp.]